MPNPMEKEATRLRKAIKKAQTAGEDTAALEATLETVVKAIEYGDAQAIDPRIQDLDDQLAYIEAQKAEVIDSVVPLTVAVKDTETRLLACNQAHRDIASRRAMGEERPDDAANLYMYSLDIERLTTELESARAVENAARQPLAELNAQIQHLNEQKVLTGYRIAEEEARNHLAEIDSEFVKAFADWLQACSRARMSPLGRFNLSMDMRRALQYYNLR